MTDLSPAAQAVLGAFRAVPDLRDCPNIAAALRAAADQVVPQGGPFLMTASEDRVRHQLLAIAAELEGGTRDPLEPNDLSHLSEEEFQALAPQGYHAL